MQHAGLVIPLAPQASFNVKHATEITEHYRISTAGMDVVALVVDDGSRNIAVLHCKGTAKTAAVACLIHFRQLHALAFGEQLTRLRLYPQFAQTAAGIVIVMLPLKLVCVSAGSLSRWTTFTRKSVSSKTRGLIF